MFSSVSLAGCHCSNRDIAGVIALVEIFLKRSCYHDAFFSYRVNVVDFLCFRPQQSVEVLWLMYEMRLREVITHSKLTPE